MACRCVWGIFCYDVCVEFFWVEDLFSEILAFFCPFSDFTPFFLSFISSFGVVSLEIPMEYTEASSFGQSGPISVDWL